MRYVAQQRTLCAIFGWLLLIGVRPAVGQQILIDRGIQAEGLWCFPLASDTLTYLYLPDEARIALDDAGQPQFSMLRYVINTPSENNGRATTTEADGGAIVHFLVEYRTDSRKVSSSEHALREALESPNIKLQGPIIFDEGRYALISSVLSPTEKPSERHLLATGQAPVLEGGRIALSFDMSPEDSRLLMESFKMATPDVSIVFDMSFSGLSEAYNAELKVHWSQVHQSMGGHTGGSLYFIGAEVEAMFDDLRRDHAIELTTSGSDEVTEALVNTVYDKLLALMFEPLKPEQIPERGGLWDALSKSLGNRGLLSSQNISGFGLNLGYEMKRLKSEGTSVMQFNSQSSMQRHHFITFNAGDLYQRYGSDQRFFRTQDLDDPAFQQREVQVAIDGELIKEFGDLVNSVSVTLRKQHSNGEQTVREILVDRRFAADSLEARLVYGSKDDADRLAWLGYEYRTKWQFQGGEYYQTDWVPERSSMINLYAPYERRSIQLVGSIELLDDLGIRAVVARVTYPFFSKTRIAQLVVRPGDAVEDKRVDITLPLNQYDYEYSITWYFRGGEQRSVSGRDASGLLFIDEAPTSDESSSSHAEPASSSHSTGQN